MAKKRKTTRKSGGAVAGISDAAVHAKTGKTWPEWVALLDRAGGREMNHKQLVAVVNKKYNVGPWWQQMVAVGYEQAAGLRAKGERPDGFSVSKSKTIAAPMSTIFSAWQNDKVRARWLAHPQIAIRTATRNKSLRITWADRKTNVEVNFYNKGGGKNAVAVQHNKLTNARAADKMKAYWGKQLDKLATLVARRKSAEKR
jgi:hypothetical protein